MDSCSNALPVTRRSCALHGRDRSSPIRRGDGTPRLLPDGPHAVVVAHTLDTTTSVGTGPCPCPPSWTDGTRVVDVNNAGPVTTVWRDGHARPLRSRSVQPQCVCPRLVPFTPVGAMACLARCLMDRTGWYVDAARKRQVMIGRTLCSHMGGSGSGS